MREAPLDAEWDHLPPIGLTIGWIQMNDDSTSNMLIACADEALYQDKESRRKADE